MYEVISWFFIITSNIVFVPKATMIVVIGVGVAHALSDIF